MYLNEHFTKEHSYLNRKKYFQTNESDYDYKVFERVFSGRITKARYKLIDRICRLNSYHTHCGHEWDCCGCLCGQHMEFTYKQNQVVIRFTQSFNY